MSAADNNAPQDLVTVNVQMSRVAISHKPILNDLSLSMRGGEFIAVVGPNGSGKTTFLRMLAGLLRGDGDLLLNGTPLHRHTLQQRARLVSYLPQDTRQPVWPMPVCDIVALGLLPFDADLQTRYGSHEQAIDRQLAACDLTAIANRPVDRISGGERMRALLARALVGGQPLILMDEPLTSLDPAHQLRLMQLMAERAKAGHLVIAVLHDIDLALHFASRVVAFDQGAISADGTPAEIYASGVLEKIFGVTIRGADTEGGRILAMRL
jgi:iron complex transport system ATP-binding protein